jgi:hypothetical protein
MNEGIGNGVSGKGGSALAEGHEREWAGWQSDWTWAGPSVRGNGRLGQLSVGHHYRED